MGTAEDGEGVKSGNDDQREFSFGVSITKNHSSLTELTERDRIGLVDLTELTKKQ